MAQGIYGESLFSDPTRGQVAEAEAGLGMFTHGLKTAQDYMHPHSDPAAEALVQQFNNDRIAIEQARQADIQAQANKFAIDEKRRKLEEAARLKALAGYRKDPLVRNEDGSLHTDSDLELRAKQGVNGLIGLWNKANDYLPDFIAKDKTLDVNWAPTATINGMAHEDLRNKDIFGARDMSKQDVVNAAKNLKDDPNGQGTLYYLKRNIGTDENPEYIYKVGFAELNAADRYRSQVSAAGWDIVKEVQSSGSADLEKKIQAKFMDDRLMSSGQVKGADGKYHNHDEASGINFGGGYTEIYKKDILGWDKKSTAADLNKFKVQAMMDASKQGLTQDQMAAYRQRINAMTTSDLDQMQLDQNKQASFAKRDANDVYRHGRDDSLWSATKAGLTKVGREAADDVLDIITPEGMTQNTMLGQWLQSDEKGNSQRLDKWKEQEAVDKDVGYNRRTANEAMNAMMYNYNKGDYVGVLSNALFSQGGFNTTAESLGYMAPMLVPAIFSGGTSAIAQGGMRAKAAYQEILAAKNAAQELQAVGKTAEAAAELKKISGLEAIIQSETGAIGSKLSNAAKFAEKAGFYGQAAAMTNERIDAHMQNNGGQPTSLFDNAAIFAETVVENAIDKFTDMAVLGVAGRKELQSVYSLLDDAAKKNVLTKVASKAVALSASAGIEGATEYIQNVGQSLSEQYGTKKNGGTIEGILSSKENQEDNIVNFLMGAAGGMHMQSVPTGLKMLKDGGSKLLYNYGGGKVRDEESERINNLATQIVSGTVDPHNNPIVLRQDQSGTNAAIQDISHIVTSRDGLSSQVAQSIIASSAGVDHMVPDANGNEVKSDPIQLIKNIDKSIRTTFKVDENGRAPDPLMQARYEHTMYESAMSTIKNIIDIHGTMKSNLAKQGVEFSDENTNKAIESVFSAYASVIPQEQMKQIMLMTAAKMLDAAKRSAASETADEIVKGGLADQGGKGFSINVDLLRKTAARMNSMVMGSMSDGHAPKEAIDAVKKTQQMLEDEISKAGDAQKVHLDNQFFDYAKNTTDVGNEILFSGKTDADGKRYGKGIYQHAEAVIDSLHSASDPSKGKNSKVNLEPLNAWLSFATGRAKIRQEGTLADKYMTYDEVHEYDGKRKSYNYNYIPEKDANGKTALRKISEAEYMIKEAERVRAAVELAKNISEDSRKEMIDKLNQIIEENKHDIEVLKSYANRIQKGEINKDQVLVDLRREEEYFKDKPKFAKKLAEIQAKIKEAEETGNGKFGPKSPIFTMADKYKPSSDRGSNEQESKSDAEEQSKDQAADSDNTKSKVEDKSNEQELSSERPSEQNEPLGSNQEDSKSTKDSEDDKSGTPTSEKSDSKPESKSRQQIEDDLLAEAEAELQRLEDENVSMIQDIASEAGIEFEYDHSEPLSVNLRNLRKAITQIVNGYKASVKAEIGMYFTKADKLATLLTQATKGVETGNRKIDKNDNVVEAKTINDKKHELTFKGNQELKDNAGRAKNIKKTADAIKELLNVRNERSLSDAEMKQLKTLYARLQKLLGKPVDKAYKVSKSVEKKVASNEVPFDKEDELWLGTDYSMDYKSAGMSKEDIAFLEAMYEAEKEFDAMNTVGVETESEKQADEDPANHEEEVSELAEEESSKKEISNVIDARKNVFSVLTNERIQKNLKEIESVKVEMKKKEATMIEEKISELARAYAKEHGVLKGENASDKFRAEAKALVEKEMEKC